MLYRVDNQAQFIDKAERGIRVLWSPSAAIELSCLGDLQFRMKLYQRHYPSLLAVEMAKEIFQQSNDIHDCLLTMDDQNNIVIHNVIHEQKKGEGCINEFIQHGYKLLSAALHRIDAL
ncbi:hypothetical protein LMG33818_002187 [Halomonadaceae bacterium LMG 33818]|uniref:hypothetical protein n=1 Tax=Cernens ardua TaxID=3402176 RepID=UPI003EDC6FB3